MKPKLPTLLSMTLCLALAGPVLADKPDKSAGKSHKRETEQHKASAERHDEHGDGRHESGHQAGAGYFSEDLKLRVRKHYAEEFRTKGCPPGLAKKNNGCLPPGQAKQWKLGQPLPAEVVVYDVPAVVVAEIGLPPAGQKIVRVANDLLLIAVGSGMVIEAIEDLGSL